MYILFLLGVLSVFIDELPSSAFFGGGGGGVVVLGGIG